ncbi:hypothetical protein [Nocardia sp. NPDC006630]|uniref:hypothetical protein n=1 Tax=Nocardia sp. NPDC006630 TaxID=3157181 RepID=UPI0033A9129A
MSALFVEVSEKVDRLRSVLSRGRYLRAEFPPGVELDDAEQLAGYHRTMEYYFASGHLPAEARAGLDELTLPRAMVELYRITAHPKSGRISLFQTFDKGEIMDPHGWAHRDDEHWLAVGSVADDKFLVSLMTGEVMFADHQFSRPGDVDTTRIVAPDLLTFFDECMIGPRYGEFVSAADLTDPAGWFRFLQDNDLA